MKTKRKVKKMNYLKFIPIFLFTGLVFFVVTDYFKRGEKIKELSAANSNLKTAVEQMQEDRTKYEKYMEDRFSFLKSQQVIFSLERQKTEKKVEKIQKIETTNDCDFSAFFKDLERGLK